MKFILTILLVLSAVPAHAGLGWLLLAAASSEPSKNVVEKTELQIQIENINKTLPKLCTGANKYSGCWSQYSDTEKSYSASSTNASNLESYYQNAGYNVHLDDKQLVFNFQEEHEKFIFVENLFITAETLLVLVFLSLFPMFYFYLKLRYKKRVTKIQEAYENSKDKLLFWEKGGKEKLEEYLSRKELPGSWQFSLSNEKITSITFYNGRSIGRIASCTDGLFDSLKGLVNMEERIKSAKERYAKEKAMSAEGSELGSK